MCVTPGDVAFAVAAVFAVSRGRQKAVNVEGACQAEAHYLPMGVDSRTAKAKTAYQDFLMLWKDADRDIPIFKQAEAEYAKLR